MENHDCRKSQVSHFFKNKSTPWLHDLTLAQHTTVKAAAIFRDKFCLIGFVFCYYSSDFYSLLFEFHDEGITISCFVLDDKKSVYGAKGQLRQRVQRVEVSHLSGALATTSNLIPSYAYTHLFLCTTQKGMSATN